MEGTIVVSPGLPEVAPENAESLGFLSELISDSLGHLDSLKRSASTAILDLLEANVRLGWYLEDARHFLRKEGTSVAWIEQTCPLLDFTDPRTRGLFAGQQNRAGHVFGFQHARVADPFLRPASAKRKFGLHASGTDHADLDPMRS
jgi:hypothetical protein